MKWRYEEAFSATTDPIANTSLHRGIIQKHVSYRKQKISNWTRGTYEIQQQWRKQKSLCVGLRKCYLAGRVQRIA